MELNQQLGAGRNRNNMDDRNQFLTLMNACRAELELMVINAVQRCVVPSLEPLIRRVVAEQIELAEEKLLACGKLNPESQASSSGSRCLALQILPNRISQPLLTGEKLKGEENTPIKVSLVDVLTGNIVNSGPEAGAKVEIVVLKEECEGVGGDNWTQEEFNQNIIRERKGGKSILQGNTYLNLNGGVGLLGEISFTHNADWTTNSKFRLGARVVDAVSNTRVKESRTEPFIVKDRRSMLYEKRHPPSLSDQVWRLEQIAKNGAYHKRLRNASVCTVRDFRTLLYINPKRLQEVLGLDAAAKMWKTIEDHARECLRDEGMYLYNDPSNQQKSGVVFNVEGELMGVIGEACYIPIDKLSEEEKAYARKLVIYASECWKEVSYFDNLTSLKNSYFKLKNLGSSMPSHILESPDCSNFRPPLDVDRLAHASTSTQIAESSSILEVGTNRFGNLGLCSSRNMEINSDVLNDFNQSPNRSIIDGIDIDIDEIWQCIYSDHNLQPDNLNGESYREQSCSGSDNMLVSVCNTPSRWTQVARLMKQVLVKRKIIEALEGLLAENKRRRCQ